MPRPPATATWRPSRGLFEACIPAVPYVPATAFLGGEKAKLAARRRRVRRVALVIDDAIGSMHGVTHTIEQIREHGVPGFEVDVIGTDPRVDRRLPAVAELEVPFYAGLRLGVPGLPEPGRDAAPTAATTSSTSPPPGPAGVAATLLGRIAGTPLLASYHTELARLRRDAQRRRALWRRRPRGARRLLRPALGRPLAEPGRRPLAASPSGSTPIGSPAGRAASTSPASTRGRATRTPTRARSRCSTPAA